MSAASNEAQPIEANVERSATFGAALAAIQAAERMYLHLGRVTASSCDYQEPALFCDEILKRALAVAELAGAEARARFFAWATDAAPRCKLLSVLACTDHLMRGESHLARMYAKRALSLNQNDLHAQALYRRCLRRRPSDPDLRGRFCDNPFDKLETHTRGEVYFCCPAWLPIPIGKPPDPVDRGDLELAGGSGHPQVDSRRQLSLLQSHALPETDRKQVAQGQRG
jgi:hypothetical protein